RLSVAPIILTIGCANITQTTLKQILIIISIYVVCLNILIPFSSSFAPKYFDINAPPPTDTIVARPKNTIVIGITILTAPSAASPIPFPKNTPSIIVFNDAIHIAKADGIAYPKNCLIIYFYLLFIFYL